MEFFFFYAKKHQVCPQPNLHHSSHSKCPKNLDLKKKNQIIVFYVKLGGTLNIVTQCLYSEIIFTLPAIELSGTVADDVAVEDFLPNKKTRF